MADSGLIDVTVEVRLDMRSSPAGFGSMQIREDFRLPVAGFTELAGILGKFHELAERVKAEHDRDT